ncbi:MAG: PstS family phosphate ABC transporter substrate-binding protein [Planctomycetaceae bacterium]|nr:PstS family phosphate ABC transporter substrate-binding protein [Planctomycetaceae bacterium]
MPLLRTLLACSLMLTLGCQTQAPPAGGGGGESGGEETITAGDTDTKRILIDGSSTVEPLSAAMAQVFGETHSEFDTPSVKISGTGGGFQKFGRGEIDISDASRPIKEGEAAACAEAGIEPVELKVAIDGLSVVVNKDNDWCTALTVAQLKAIWSAGSEIKKWSDINPDWPAEEIQLFGPDAKSGTHDYFKEVILDKDAEFRADFSPNSDDNVLVTGIAGEKFALGFFGFTYLVENQDRIKAVAISATDKAEDAVVPTPETIESGAYTPLARPLFIYVTKQGLQRADIAAFCDFYLSDEGQEVVRLKKFIGLNAEQLAASREALAAAKDNE